MAYANVVKNNGFVPFERAVVNADVRTRPVPAVRTASGGGNASTDIAIGDAYAIDSAGNAYRAGPSDTIRGVVVGFEFQPNPSNPPGSAVNSTNYITGNGGKTTTTQIASIIGIEDSACIFECQADTLVLGTPPYGVYTITDAAPDAFYGISNQSVSIGGGSGGSQAKLIGLKPSPGDNSYGVGARILVQFPQMSNA